MGGTVADITAIVLSHHDHDHIGSLAELKRRNRRSGYSRARRKGTTFRKETIAEAAPGPGVQQTLSGEEKEFGERFAPYLETVEHCPVDDVVQDMDYICGGVKVH